MSVGIEMTSSAHARELGMVSMKLVEEIIPLWKRLNVSIIASSGGSGM